MTTIINTPPSSPAEVSDNSGVGVVVGIVIALLVVVLFFVFGLPYLRSERPASDSDAPSVTGNINVTLPENSGTNNTVTP